MSASFGRRLVAETRRLAETMKSRGCRITALEIGARHVGDEGEAVFPERIERCSEVPDELEHALGVEAAVLIAIHDADAKIRGAEFVDIFAQFDVFDRLVAEMRTGGIERGTA
jgi:hypothetical protein